MPKFYKNGFEEFDDEELAKKIRGCTSCQQAILCCCRGGLQYLKTSVEWSLTVIFISIRKALRQTDF